MNGKRGRPAMGEPDSLSKESSITTTKLGSMVPRRGADKVADWDEKNPEPARRMQLTRASDIRPRRVRWLWEGRIAMGTLALLAGREGLGKSTLAYAIAAQVTRGELTGEYRGQARPVLVCASEDDWEFTIVPRLIAAGADLDMVYRIEILADGVHVGLSLPKDIRATEDASRQTGAALLILDPLISRLGSLDTHRDSEVRQALEPLVQVAGRTGIAVLGLIHHNKSGSADPLHLVMGSRAFTAVARSVHSVVPDPDDPTDTRRLFGTPKNNLGRSDLPTLAFTVQSHGVQTDDGTALSSRIEWLGVHDGTIAEAMRQSNDLDRDPTAADEATHWLEDFLSINGRTESAKVKAAAAKAGHRDKPLRSARQKLKVETESEGFPRTTYWRLPSRDLASHDPSRGEGMTDMTDSTGAQLDSVASVASVMTRQKGTGTNKDTTATTTTRSM